MRSLALLKISFFIACLLVAMPRPSAAQEKSLGIPPVMQQTPVWCWAATAEMVLRHYQFPSINPVGNFQCGVVGSIGGQCWSNCAACVSQAGPTTNLVPIISNYANLAHNMTGFVPSQPFSPSHHPAFSPQQIMTAIDNNVPIIAGISVGATFQFPGGLGMSQHVVVIHGYAVRPEGFLVQVNDPYPYPPNQDPYLQVGSTMIQPGMYAVRYDALVGPLNYANTVVF